MKHYNMTSDGRRVTEEEANAINDLTEDVPMEAPPTGSLPPMKRMDPDPDLEKVEKKGEGMERAMEILDEYEEGVPGRDPDTPQYEE